MEALGAELGGNYEYAAYLVQLALFFCGYLLGSIPFGLLLTRWAGLGDVWQIGSGNIGATNVLRTGNKKIAALTLLLDALKGTVAVLLGYAVTAFILKGHPAPDHLYTLIALPGAIGALLGHMFPVWLKFKGGKGVATYLGILVAFSWIGALTFGLVWLGVAVITRYSSLAALIAVLCVPLAMVLTHYHMNAVTAFFLMSLLIIFKHKANIIRLLNGSESKIGSKGK